MTHFLRPVRCAAIALSVLAPLSAAAGSLPRLAAAPLSPLARTEP
jgi:hypothetical protein